MSRRFPSPGTSLPAAPSLSVGHTAPAAPPSLSQRCSLSSPFCWLAPHSSSPGMTRFVILSHPHCCCSTAGPSVSITNAPVSSLHTTWKKFKGNLVPWREPALGWCVSQSLIWWVIHSLYTQRWIWLSEYICIHHCCKPCDVFMEKPVLPQPAPHCPFAEGVCRHCRTACGLIAQACRCWTSPMVPQTVMLLHQL